PRPRHLSPCPTRRSSDLAEERDEKSKRQQDDPDPEQVYERFLVGLYDEPVFRHHVDTIQEEVRLATVDVHSDERDRKAPVLRLGRDELLGAIVHDHVDGAQGPGFTRFQIGKVEDGGDGDLGRVGGSYRIKSLESDGKLVFPDYRRVVYGEAKLVGIAARVFE